MVVATAEGFRVSREFRETVPPLLKDELAQLEENLCANGCRDPLVLWKEQNILLDGHNRLEICNRHGLKYRTVGVSLPDRDSAKAWVIKNQFGRRNITPFQRVELALKLEPLIAAKAKEKQRDSGGAVVQKSGKPPVKTDRELAKVAKVSHDTLHKGRVIAREADEDTKTKLRSGEKTINSVYRDIEKRKRVADIAKKATAEAKAAPAEGKLSRLEEGAGRFRCVYLDPPWQYDDAGCRGAAEGHYPTLSTEKLMALPLGPLAHADGCHFWMWTTWPMIREGTAHKVLGAWGLRWVGEVVWNKARIGAGRWLRSQTEVLVLAVKGTMPLLASDQGNYLEVKRTGRHSEKPEEFRSLVERLSPGPRLELFARRSVNGWNRWGLEA